MVGCLHIDNILSLNGHLGKTSRKTYGLSWCEREAKCCASSRTLCLVVCKERITNIAAQSQTPLIRRSLLKLGRKYLDAWVIEDNGELRATLVEAIESEAEMMCSLSFVKCKEAITALQTESPPQVMLMDIGLPIIKLTTALRQWGYPVFGL